MCCGIFFAVLLVGMQVGIIVLQQYSLMHVTRESARWLAIHPDTQDDALIAHVRANPLSLNPNNIVSVVPDPPCNWGGSPAHCQDRIGSAPIRLTVTYDVSNQLFLPSATLNAFGIPTSLRSYSVALMIE